MIGVAAAGAVLLTACDPSLNSETQGVGASTSYSAAGTTPETRQMAQKVGTFVAASTPGNTAYKIGGQDVLDIVVFMVPELTRNIQVADSGTINLPLVGEVPAAGRTFAAARTRPDREARRPLSEKSAGQRLREGVQQPARNGRGRGQAAGRLSATRENFSHGSSRLGQGLGSRRGVGRRHCVPNERGTTCRRRVRPRTRSAKVERRTRKFKTATSLSFRRPRPKWCSRTS